MVGGPVVGASGVPPNQPVRSTTTWVPEVDPRIWQAAGISAACIAGIKQEADRELEALALALLPGFTAARRATNDSRAKSAA